MLGFCRKTLRDHSLPWVCLGLALFCGGVCISPLGELDACISGLNGDVGGPDSRALVGGPQKLHCHACILERDWVISGGGGEWAGEGGAPDRLTGQRASAGTGQLSQPHRLLQEGAEIVARAGRRVSLSSWQFLDFFSSKLSSVPSK